MFPWESGSDALSRTKAERQMEWLDLIFKVSCDADGEDRPVQLCFPDELTCGFEPSYI